MTRTYSFFRSFPFFIAILFAAAAAHASHLVGGDLSYTHISGSTYKITLTMYGDCGPASSAAFATLPTGTPKICVYDGGTYVTTLTLAIEPPSAGVEITPLCPGAVSQCVSPTSPVPAVKRFVYSATYTMPHTSTVWRFIFNSDYGTSAAGRAAAITNLQAPIPNMQLIDTLNNSSYTNSSPSLAVTQSTFFCLNDFNNYNPAATDPDGDVLSFALVDATAATSNCTSVGPASTYIVADAWPGTPVSGATPLRVAAGTFGFNPVNGQLSFYPNVLQRAVIVYNIREIRGGVLVGTSQREMTVLVTGSCATTSPCAGTPIAGVGSIGVGCSGAPDTLMTSGYSCAGVNFQWQSSADGITWSNIAGATAPQHPLTPAASLYYRCAVTCISSGQTSYTGAVFYPLSVAGVLHTTVSYPTDTACSGADFKMKICPPAAGYTAITYFGDGTNATCSFTPTTAAVSHNYAYPGTYTVKHIVYNGATAVDSVIYPLVYNFCRTLPVKFYNDNNSNCIYDGGDTWNHLPVTVQVDSNGVHVNTITCTGGLYYKALGGPGTVYSFNVTGTPAGLTASCPSSASISVTILATAYTYAASMFGLHCSGASGFDLQELVSFRAGTHIGKASILVTNPYCTAANDTVTMSFSPKYAFVSSSPAPASVVGNVVKWVPGAISAISAPQNINVTLNESTAFLLPGDTVNSDYVTTPLTGDLNPANNTVHRVDTVFAPWDPNAMSVTPEGFITAGTELQYTVDFENMGNAPAVNIHILDTLSGYHVPGTLAVAGASAAMNMVVMNSGPYTVAKFDFPNINLPDSSHHNECHGMVVFKIKTMTGLAPGTLIPNRAGIYFDDNEVVMTNTVTNIITTPTAVAGVDRNNTIIYPNPANNTINIMAAPGDYDEIVITNTVGQAVIKTSFPSAGNSIDIHTLRAGLYYVTLHGKNGTTTGKFVKL